MQHADYLAALDAELDRFAPALPAADPGAPVPSCPGWTVADLIGHVGSTFQWVVANVRAGGERVSYRQFLAEIPTEAAALPAWFDGQAASLRDTLHSTDPDQPSWSWAADQRAGFWGRRMLHELGIHHVDLLLATDQPVSITPEVAEDGVDEFLVNLPYTRWATGVAELTNDGRRIGLATTDTGTSWLITLGPDGIGHSRTNGVADAAVSGTAEELYLFSWGRLPAPTITGDPDLIATWVTRTAL